GRGAFRPETDVMERAALLPVGEVEKRSRVELGDVDAGRRVPEADQLVGAGIWQRPQQDALNDAEDRRVRADARGERHQGEERERGSTAEPPDDLRELGRDRHVLSTRERPSRVAELVFSRLNGSHLGAGLALPTRSAASVRAVSTAARNWR